MKNAMNKHEPYHFAISINNMIHSKEKGNTSYFPTRKYVYVLPLLSYRQSPPNLTQCAKQSHKFKMVVVVYSFIQLSRCICQNYSQIGKDQKFKQMNIMKYSPLRLAEEVPKHFQLFFWPYPSHSPITPSTPLLPRAP